MTIKFFPIFFAEEVGRDGMSPLAVNLMMTAMPLLIGAFSNIAQRLSGPLGALGTLFTSFLFKAIRKVGRGK